ncbi:MAG: TIGR02186 family protein, partial [Nitrospirota bacterium]
SNLYFKTEGGFKLTNTNNAQSYYMKFKWPYQAAPGNYLVTVYAVKDGRVVEQATSNVLVEQVGTVKALADMAKNNGAFYGILAIVSALGTGFGVGLVFGKGGGAH